MSFSCDVRIHPLIYVYIYIWTTIDRLSTIWKSDLTDEIKQEFCEYVAVPVPLYSCTTNIYEIFGETSRWKLCKDAAYCFEPILEAAAPKHQFYSHLLPISLTIQVRRARQVRFCWRSKGELISGMVTLEMAEQQNLTFISSDRARNAV